MTRCGDKTPRDCGGRNLRRGCALNDFQKLLGDINWLWPSVGIPTYALQNLFKILEGSPDPNSPRQLTKEAKDELALVEKRIQQSFLTRLDYDQLFF